MSIFSDALPSLCYPIEKENSPGFRRPQIAAIHSISAHFFNAETQAIVVMPTGAGKTAVLETCPFVLEAKRVLVLTPSRLVREQIAREFRQLAILKRIQAISSLQTPPLTQTVTSNITSEEQWRSLERYDVVISTVNSLHGSIEEHKHIVSDLFDLILVDEAHHSPAKTWNKVLSQCKKAKKVLFTATPYRRDEKEIVGKIIFNYDISRAHSDGIFGNLEYIAAEGEEEDYSIAKKTEEIFIQDREQGLKHYLMVRVDSKKRAKELLKLYDEETTLQLAFICGTHSLPHVERTLAKLTNSELDGLVCVDMFGEGVDIPNFKIAAIHSPHKSLAVTLQFIGRFARTSGENIGTAKFIASPNASAGELSLLYENKADWKEIVQNLSYSRVQNEINRRVFIDSFHQTQLESTEPLSLYDLNPYAHAMVYQISGEADISQKPTPPFRYKEIFFGVSEEQRASVLISEKRHFPDWIRGGKLENVEYAVTICYISLNKKLLFICSSLRNFGLYKSVAKDIITGGYRAVYHSQLSKALSGMESPEFFSIGMKNRHFSGNSESYRIITGSAADKAIQQSDARLYDRGHCFGRGLVEGNLATLGISSSSKIWSNKHCNILELTTWLEDLANKICSSVEGKTNCNLDILSTGEPLGVIGSTPFASIWPAEVYERNIKYTYMAHNYAPLEASPSELTPTEGNLSDLDIEILESNESVIHLKIFNEEFNCNYTFVANSNDTFIPAQNSTGALYIYTEDGNISITDYLDYNPINFFMSDMSRIQGNCLYKGQQDIPPIEENIFKVIDWESHDVNIQKEKPANSTGVSLFEWTESYLNNHGYCCIFNDDGAGEVADYIAVKCSENSLLIDFYHCKASHDSSPGYRIDEMYEVCGQAVKSSFWAKSKQLTKQIQHRMTLKNPHFVLGSFELFDQKLNRNRPAPPEFRIFIVQPGCANSQRSRQINELLAATKSYLHAGGIKEFGAFVSN